MKNRLYSYILFLILFTAVVPAFSKPVDDSKIKPGKPLFQGEYVIRNGVTFLVLKQIDPAAAYQLGTDAESNQMRLSGGGDFCGSNSNTCWHSTELVIPADRIQVREQDASLINQNQGQKQNQGYN